MTSLLRAEWIKINKNIKLTGSLVWVFPIATAAIYGLGLLLFGSLMGEEVEPTLWTNEFSMIWGFINSFPGNVFGRLLPLAFMATVFAGEYQWRTWKNIVPRRSRWALIVSKQIVLVAIIVLAFFLTSVVTVFFQAIRHGLAEIAYQPAFSTQAISDFLQLYLREAGFGIISLFLMSAFAAIAAILTRSVLGSLLIALGLSVLELVSGLLLAFIGHFINWPALVNAYQFMPSYSIENIRSWLVNNIAYTAPLPEFAANPSLFFSLMVLGVWLLGSTGLAIWLFQRQDITG
jgi:ABC-type transport system involved in multi-copper enzyme maturation permease subunit